MKILIRSVILILVLALLLPSSIVMAVPTFHLFWGTVTLDGSPAPDGTTVTATMSGYSDFSDSTSGGIYGITINADSDDAGKPINFFVNGIGAGSSTFIVQGNTEKNLSASSPIPQKILTISTNPSNAGNPSGRGTHDEGETVNIRANPKDCWEFVNWTGETGGIADVNDPTTTIIMNDDYDITANYSPLPDYTLEINIIGEGTVSGDGTYCEDQKADITATANEGWEFVSWTGDVANPDLASTSVIMNADKTVTANFSQIGVTNYILTINVNGSGSTIPAAGGYPYPEGTVVDISATPDEGWQFDSWSGDVANPSSASTTVAMNGDKTITASFSQIPTYTLTIEVDGNGSITPEAGVYSYPDGMVVDISATPDEGWQFDSWSGDVANPSSASTTVTMNGDKTITASFIEEEIVVYTLTVAITGNGSTSPIPGTHQYEQGELVDVSATPDEGWQFDGWSGDVSSSSSASTTVTMDGDKTISASFIEEEIVDAAPPVVSGVSAVGASRTAVDITWITDEPSDSQVDYWASPGQLSPLDSTLVTSHSVRLTELTPATTYYFMVMSKDINGNLTVSEEYSFTTAATEATFSTASWNTTLDNVEDGTQLTISFTVTNSGDLAGTYVATLDVNGIVVDTEEVSLETSASQVITLTTTQSAVDTYTVSVDGFTLSFAVVATGGGGIGWLPVIGIIIGLLLLIAAIIIYLKRDELRERFARRKVFAGAPRGFSYPEQKWQVKEAATVADARTVMAEAEEEAEEEEEPEREVEEESGGLIITTLAMLKLREALQVKALDPEMGFRIISSPSKPGQLKMIMDRIKEGDKVVESEGVKVLFISPALIPMLEEMIIDYHETPQGGGFTISRPAAD